MHFNGPQNIFDSLYKHPVVMLLTIMGFRSPFKYFVKLHDEEEDTDLRNTHRQRQRSKNNPSNAQTNVLRKSSWVFRKREEGDFVLEMEI